jgi:hypothetical protein
MLRYCHEVSFEIYAAVSGDFVVCRREYCGFHFEYVAAIGYECLGWGIKYASAV